MSHFEDTIEKGASILDFLEELDAGTFKDALSYELSQAAMAAVQHGKKAEITLKISLKQINESSMVMSSVEMGSKRPKHMGSKSETSQTAAVHHVGKYGKLTDQPETQQDLFPKPTPVVHNFQKDN